MLRMGGPTEKLECNLEFGHQLSTRSRTDKKRKSLDQTGGSQELTDAY